MASTPATGQGRPALRRNQVSMPATMKSAGMLKLRKFNTPIASVNATATSAYTLPSIRPLTSCCSSMLRHVLHRPLGAGQELLEEAHGLPERLPADVREKGVVDAAQLRQKRLESPAARGRHAEEDASRIVRIGALGEQLALDQPLRLSGDECAGD